MSRVDVRSLYGGRTRLPLVELAITGQPPIQCSPGEARDLALNLLEAAEASEQDAFMIEFGAAKGDDKAGLQLLVAFREWREKHGQARS